MGVSSAVNRNDYIGAGTLSAYDYDFRIFEETDLAVFVRSPLGVETELVLSTDYDVNGVDEATGGDIDLVDNDQAWLTNGKLTSGWALSIRRILPIVQETDIRNQGPYYPDIIEDQFDKLVMIDQQQQDDLDRSVKAPDTEGDIDLTLPALEDRANQLAGWDSDGKFRAVGGSIDTSLVTPFIATLLDDPDAATARATLGAQQDISTLTSLTSPALADVLGIYDDDAAAHRKITPDNLLKVINLLTKHTSPVPSDILPVYDSAGAVAKGIYLPSVFAGAKVAGAFSNIGFTAGSDDTLTIGGADASQSASNPAYLNMPDTDSYGRTTTFIKTADVNIALGAAHWGLDGLGNISFLNPAELWVIAINDGSGTLKYGLTVKGGLTKILNTACETDAANVTTAEKVLVTGAVEAGTWPVIYLGFILCARNDSSNAWTIGSTAGELSVGRRINDSTAPLLYTPTVSGLGTIGSVTMYWERRGRYQRIWGSLATGTVGSSEAQFGLSSSVLKIAPSGSPGTISPVGRYTISRAGGTSIKTGPMLATSGNTYVNFGNDDYTTANSPFVARTGSAIFSSAETFFVDCMVPILGWSSN